MKYKGRNVKVTDTKIEIRRIYQISGDVFDIYDYMIMFDGIWHSFCSEFNTLEDAISWAPNNTRIEDVRS